MKRCPECRRDYYDDTLAFCLEDGTALIQGAVPAPIGSSDEPQTAILHETAPPSCALTVAQIHTTERTAVFPSGISEKPKESFDKRLFLAPIALALIMLGVFSAYRYLAPAKQIESIAVMPFVNESGNPDVEYLSDGMTEMLIKSLSQVSNLSVKSRSAVFFYKGKEMSPKSVGEELGVQAVLLGRVGGRGDELKLNLELVNTQTQDVIWTEQYDRRRADLVSLQSDIAKDVSAKLKSRLSGADEAKVTKTSTADPEAYQAYLKGRYYWSRRTGENINKAIEQFKAATDRDPNYALAHAGLADCYIVLPQYAGTPASETLPKATASAERAISIDAQLAEPHASLGQVYKQSWRWEDAEREYKRAIELNPNYATTFHWYSLFLKDSGRFDESAVMIKRAKELDPLSSVISINIAEMYQWQNDHDATIQQALKILEIDPNYADAYRVLGLSYLKLGQQPKGIEHLQKATVLSGGAAFTLSDLGYGYGATGKKNEANAIAKELEGMFANRESAGQYVAAVYASLGEKDKAFEWLEKDFQNKAALTEIRWAITFESLRGDPRFKDLLKRMKLPE